MAANSVLTKYQNLANQLQSELYSKPGATTSGSEPSRTDVQKEIQLIKTKAGLRRVLAEQRAADWYGTPTTKPAAKEEKREGVVSKIINVLSTPLYGIVGAAETALGKGTRKGLIENIKSNIKEKGTFGDLLRSYNAPRALAMPLGFALDVMFDPVNWTIAGTAALIPRVAVGAARAGVKGAELGIKSGLAKKVATVGKYTPVVSRTEKYQKFADEAVKLSDDYYKAINSDAVDVLRKTIDNPDFRRRAAESLEQFLNRTKRGQKVLEMTKYSPKDWYEATRSLAIEEKTMVDKLKKIMANEPLSPAEMEELPGVVRGGKVFLPKIIKEMAEAEDLASGGYKIAKADNWAEAGRRLAGESEIDKALKAELLEKFREITAVDRTGSAALDKFAHIFRTKLKIGDVNVGEKIADAYNIFISAFKGSVIGLSPAAYTRAAIGNTAFAQMAGINIVNPNFRKYVVGAWGLVRGKGGAFEKQMLDNFITDPNWQKFLENYPSIFSRVFGYHPAFLRGRYSMEQIGDKFLEVLKKQGGGLDVISFGKEKGEVMGAFNRSLRAFKGGGKEAVNIRRKLGGVASQIAKESGVAGDVGGTTFFSSEIYQGAFKKFVNDLAAQGAAGNRFAKFLHGYFTKPMDAYELIDQSFKLGTTLYLSQVGISRNELMMIKNFMKLAPEDLARVAGKDLYKFLPDAATRSAGEIYMNYGAMPGFVKIMRTMPFFGAPFISFCRSEDTEILTVDGWKKYNELKIGDVILNLNIKTKQLEWDTITGINIFDYNSEMYSFKHRSLDILASPEHDWLIGRRENLEFPKKSGKRVRKDGNWNISRVKSKDISSLERISVVVGAENGFNRGNKIKYLSDELVELIGWFVTEGYYRNKTIGCWYKNTTPGGYSSFGITQAKPSGVDKIKNLISRLGWDVTVSIRHKDKIKNGNFDNYVFLFKKEHKEIIDKYVSNKQINIKFLSLLTEGQLKILFDTLILGDGSISKNGDIVFTQKKNDTLDTFVALALMLGYSVGIFEKKYKTKDGNEEIIYNIRANKKVYRQMKRGEVKKEAYNGVIWCPTTKNNGTWIAKRNNKIDITGNSYAMATKLGKTFAYNPAIFNKINFLLQEISGPRTPLEKKTLQSPYYNYLNRPGVVKLNYLLPFLGDNPVYLNAVNMLPYYTLNIFQPSEREYIDPAMDRISKIRDRSPFFQTPEGQVVWDYFIQPMIIRDSNPPEAPIGLFGQPLYPESAGALEKYLTYPTRDIAGALIPPISGAAGFLTSELPDRVKDYLPHYRWRQVAYALQGKGATGIPSKEPALQRTLRAMSSILGFPVYQLELRFQNKK